MIFLVPPHRRRSKVLSRNHTIRFRVQRCDGRSDGVQPVRRNDVSEKRKTREKGSRIGSRRITNRSLVYGVQAGPCDIRVGIESGKIPRPLGQRRHVGNASDAFAQDAPFVIGEEKCFVPPDRAAQRRAELVPLVTRGRFAGGRKKIPRIQRVVAEKLIQRSVKLVRAGLERHVDLPARVAAKGGVVAAGQNLELADGVHRRV